MADNDLTEYNVPAPHTNRIKVTHNAFGVRITFGESPDGTDKNERWFTAVHLPWEVFKNVGDLFTSIRAQVEKAQSDKPEQ